MFLYTTNDTVVVVVMVVASLFPTVLEKLDGPHESDMLLCMGAKGWDGMDS